MFGLALDDVDFLRRVVHVRHQVRMVSARLVLAPPKGGKERDVPCLTRSRCAWAQRNAHPARSP